MADQSLRAQFFIIREDDTMVPLVAVDELPDHIIIHGVPKTLTNKELNGLTCVGTFGTRHLKHSVTNKNQSPHTPLVGNTLAGSAQGSSESDNEASSAGHPSSVFSSSPKDGYATSSTVGTQLENHVPVQPNVGLINNNAQNRADSFLTPQNVQGHACSNIGTVGPPPLPYYMPGVKKYCSFWLRTGCCDYQQQGCMYKHEMPLDLPTLESLGHRDIPVWYRQQYQLGSFRAVDGADASFSGADLKSKIASGTATPRRSDVKNWRAPIPQDQSSSSGNETRPRNNFGNAARNKRKTAGSNISKANAVSKSDVGHQNKDIKPPVILKRVQPRSIATKSRQQSEVSTNSAPKKPEASRRGRVALQRSKHAPTVGSAKMSNASTVTTVCPHRSASVASVRSLCTEPEGEIVRKDLERRAKEEADAKALNEVNDKLAAAKLADVQGKTTDEEKVIDGDKE